MKLTDCVPQRISKLFIGSLLIAGSLGLFISGFTILPVIGLILAVPVAVLGVYFIRMHLTKECEVDFS